MFAPGRQRKELAGLEQAELREWGSCGSSCQCSLLLATAENWQASLLFLKSEGIFSGYFLFLLEQIRDGREEKELSEKVEMRAVIRIEIKTNVP